VSRITLVTMGSWGDLFPFVGLGQLLIERGHDVRLAASPAWEDIATEASVPFVGVGRRLGFEELGQHPEIFKSGAIGLRYALGRFIFDQVEELSRDLRDALDGADLAVIHPAQVAAHNVAQALGVRRVVATVFPGMIPSSYTVPGGSPLGPWQGFPGRVANRLSWKTGQAATALMFDRPINRHRRDLGLDPIWSALFGLSLRADGIVVMASPHVIDAPPDWPAKVETTSFVTWDRAARRPLLPAAEAFLTSGDAPVLVTLGSSSALDPTDFFSHVARMALDEGARVLVVTGPAQVPPGLRGVERVHVTDYAPFSVVMPRCQAVIHHAGVGTTVEAIRAGIPQVAVPRGFDQPDTAARIETLGIGVSVAWRKRHRELAPALYRILSEPSFAERAAALGAQVRTEDGALASARAIERHLP
jgi:UDP:flavonoid glycosyltransferase YjiC (YdhE family)